MPTRHTYLPALEPGHSNCSFRLNSLSLPYTLQLSSWCFLGTYIDVPVSRSGCIAALGIAQQNTSLPASHTTQLPSPTRKHCACGIEKFCLLPSTNILTLLHLSANAGNSPRPGNLQVRKRLQQLHAEEIEQNLHLLENVTMPKSETRWVWLTADLVHHIVMVWVYWLILLMPIPMAVFWVTQILRIPFLSMLAEYFSSKELQTNINVLTVASAKFILLIYLSVHYIGCAFYFSSILSGFDDSDTNGTWATQMTANSMLSSNFDEYMHPENYLMCVYRGLNMLAAFGYEPIVPKRMDEMVLSVVTILVQMVVQAYVLGTCPRPSDLT